MGVYGYALQIYCDFSGYSDMAIGHCLVIGLSLQHKLRFALWVGIHYGVLASLAYLAFQLAARLSLYIPGRQPAKGKIRQYANLIITMFLGGFVAWASWNFVFWGMLHGVALAESISSGWALPDGRRANAVAASAASSASSLRSTSSASAGYFSAMPTFSFVGYVEADIHDFPSRAFPATDSGLLGSVCLDGARLLPAFRA